MYHEPVTGLVDQSSRVTLAECAPRSVCIFSYIHACQFVHVTVVLFIPVVLSEAAATVAVFLSHSARRAAFSCVLISAEVVDLRLLHPFVCVRACRVLSLSRGLSRFDRNISCQRYPGLPV